MVRLALAVERAGLRERISRLLCGAEVTLEVAPSLRELFSTGQIHQCDAVLVDSLGEDDPHAARVISQLPNRPGLVVLAEAAGDERAAHVVESGARCVLSWTLPDEELTTRVLHAIGTNGSDGGETASSGKAGNGGAKTPMERALALAEVLAGSDSSILIEGETGSGKEWFARHIHDQSVRAKLPFVPVNCAAIPEGLAESELFGHVRGAFTGAIRSHRGHFEQADGGTLFLDEVAELPPPIQVRLLRVLQDRVVTPVGGEKEVPLDVRIMAATNRSLEEAVTAGAFREDLYYRLAVVRLEVPPLRQRRDELESLFETYAQSFFDALGVPQKPPSSKALKFLATYRWPGNVRELINVVERAVLLSTGPWLEIDEASMGLTPSASSLTLSAVAPFADAKEAALAEFERDYFVQLLTETRGKVGEAAELAGVNPRTVYNKMRALGLRKEDFRP